MKFDMRKFNELLRIQKERQLAMDALSEQLGIDISFSDEEITKFAQEEYAKHIKKQVTEEVETWMKLVFS